MKQMKRLAFPWIALILAFALALSACSGKRPAPAPGQETGGKVPAGTAAPGGNSAGGTGRGEAPAKESSQPEKSGTPPEKAGLQPGKEEAQPGKAPQVLADYDSFGAAVSALVKENPVSNWSAAAAADDEFFASRLILQAAEPMDLSSCRPSAVIAGPENLYLLQFSTPREAEAAFGTLANLPEVRYVEPDSYLGSEGETFGGADFNSWGVSAMGADRLAPYVAKTAGGRITVAVVDTGVSSHSFLGDRLLSGGYDFVDNDNAPTDLNLHGTHVAGTIVDCTPGLEVSILPVRVLDQRGSGYDSTVGAGIRYAADHGAEVINLSLGGGHSSYIDEAVAYAMDRGVCVVVAAGNNFGSIGDFCPAHITGAITVGAVDAHLQLAPFSNTGASLDLVCPGVDVVSCVPGGGYRSLDGTSMAAPHASAAAAMLRLLYPSSTPEDVERLLRSHTRDLGDPGWDQLYGAGLPDLTQFLPASAGGLSLRSEPYRTSYYVGDILDPAGLELTLTHPDGTTEIITDGYSCSPDRFYEPGSQTVTVSCQGHQTEFRVYVDWPTVSLEAYSDSKRMNCWDSYWNPERQVPLWLLPLPAASTDPAGGAVSWSIVSGQAYLTESGEIAAQQPGAIVALAEFDYAGETYGAEYTVNLSLYKTTTDVNYLQSAPTLQSEILDYVPNGATVDITEVAWDPTVQASDGIYYLYGKTVYNGVEGWIVIS